MRQSEPVGFSTGIDSPPLRFTYKNWKGVCDERAVEGVPTLWYGESDYHTGPQWFMRAFDTKKQELRDFSLKDVIKFL